MGKQSSSRIQRWSALAIGTAMAASVLPARADWTKHFRVGLQLGLNIDAEFSMGESARLSASRPGGTGFREDHFYDNGFVRVDDTGNAEVDGVPRTTVWGYDSASQIVGDTLEFHSAQSFSPIDSGSTEAEEAPYLGLEAVYGMHLFQRGRTVVGWEVGYGLLALDMSDSRTLFGDIGALIDVYPVGDVSLPDAPYRGGASGGEQVSIPGGPGDDGRFEDVFEGRISGTRELDMYMHNFRVGPTFHWELSPRWAAQASAGAAVGIVSGDYRYDEQVTNLGTTTSFRNSDRFSQTEVVYGGYLNGVVMYHVQEHADIYAGLQFMSLSDAEFEKDGRRAKIKLGAAVSFLLGVNWPF